ncbi:hypothetical protein N9Z80_02355, partial [Akkermansiaceae bacterium]|nr:hypothetical protein [Akkermansiaceae bacterium]
DSDGDGVSDELEAHQGTNPNNDQDFKEFGRGVAAFYSFDGQVRDISGSGNDLTNFGVDFTSDQNGNLNSAARFRSDGALPPSGNFGNSFGGDWLSFGNNNPLEGLHEWSISIFFKPDNFLPPAFGNAAASKIFYQERIVSININGNFDSLSSIVGNGNWYNPTFVSGKISINDGEYGFGENGPWIHYVITAKDGDLSIYSNGQKIASANGLGPVGQSNSIAGIGSHFDGLISQFSIHNRALSDEEVAGLYALESQNIQFQIIEGNFTWQEAKADAEAKGGRLAVLESDPKIDAANRMLIDSSNQQTLWIGLEKNNQQEWVWLDGTSLESTEASERTNGFNGFGSLGGGADKAMLLQDSIPDSIDDNNGLDVTGYLLEIIPQNPAPPLVQLGALFESPTGESITIDATPAAGFPAEFTYQWCFNGFKIPANLGGTASSINIDNLQANEGTWSVTVTNETGSVEQSFEYRIYVDSDSDGLSDAFEELVSLTNINKPDTDNDGLVDSEEVNTYSTNPNSSDSDSDGFTDLYELETAYDPNSAESTPDAQVNIMTAIEVDFNAALGATYEIQFSTDTIEWTVIEAGIVGEGNAVERLYTKKDFPTGFFRVERTDQ